MIHIFLTAMVVGGVSLFPETAEATVMGPSMQKLTWHYYKVYNTCENAENFVRHQVEIFYKNDKSIAPKLLRLLYSDCFVSVRFFRILVLSFNHSYISYKTQGYI